MKVYIDEKERQRRNRILKLKIYGVLIFFLLLVAGIGYLAFFSPFLKIKEISATRTAQNSQPLYPDQELIADLKKFFTAEKKSFLFFGPDHIFGWNKNTEIFLENYRGIEKLTIEKDYLGRKIKIEIKEREKFGVWCAGPASAPAFPAFDQTLTSQSANDEECFWFDKEGIIFALAPKIEGNSINKIGDFSGRSLNIGDSVLEKKFVSNLIKIFEVLEKAGLRVKSLKLKDIQLQEIVFDDETKLLPKIYFNLRIDPEFAVTAFRELKKQGLEKFEYIDLRVKSRGYYKLK